MHERLKQQLAFIRELDRLKHVLRKTYLLDESRFENSAEHSWHLAMLAALLGEYAAGADIDTARVVRMALVHDVVEIDAGDTYCYDDAGREGQSERERRAAERLFGLLPDDQAAELRALWEEFEARETPESRFANALDRFQPLLHNYLTNGRSWVENGVTLRQVLERNACIEQGAPELWRYAKGLIDDAVTKGWIRPE